MLDRVMLSSEGNENGEKQQDVQLAEKQLYTCSFLFFVHFLRRSFARLQGETSRNFLVTRFMEKNVVPVLNVCSFFTAAHFHLGHS